MSAATRSEAKRPSRRTSLTVAIAVRTDGNTEGGTCLELVAIVPGSARGRLEAVEEADRELAGVRDRRKVGGKEAAPTKAANRATP